MADDAPIQIQTRTDYVRWIGSLNAKQRSAVKTALDHIITSHVNCRDVYNDILSWGGELNK